MRQGRNGQKRADNRHTRTDTNSTRGSEIRGANNPHSPEISPVSSIACEIQSAQKRVVVIESTDAEGGERRDSITRNSGKDRDRRADKKMKDRGKRGRDKRNWSVLRLEEAGAGKQEGQTHAQEPKEKDRPPLRLQIEQEEIGESQRTNGEEAHGRGNEGATMAYKDRIQKE